MCMHKISQSALFAKIQGELKAHEARSVQYYRTEEYTRSKSTLAVQYYRTEEYTRSNSTIGKKCTVVQTRTRREK